MPSFNSELSLESADPLQRVKYLYERVSELYQAERYDEAIPLAEEALAIDQAQYGPQHRYTAFSLNKLGRLHQASGNFDKAETLYQQAFSIREEQLGSDHAETIDTLKSLASVYLEAGKYTKSKSLYQRLLVIREAELGENHLEVAQILNTLGLLHRRMGAYDKAELVYQQALSIQEQQLGTDHPDTAITIDNLALLYQMKGNYEQALAFNEKALLIFEQQLGADNFHTLLSLSNLASLYQETGRYDQAKRAYYGVLTAQVEQLGEDHPETAISLDNLASLYNLMGRYEKALSLNQRSLKILEQRLGNNHPNTVIALNNLASLYQKMERYQEAEAIFLQVVASQKAAFGDFNSDTATSLRNLGQVYDAMGRYEDAHDLFSQALDIHRQILGEDHPNTLTSLASLAHLHQVTGRYEESERLHKQVLSMQKQVLEGDHPGIATSLSNLGLLYKDMGRSTEAEDSLIRALEIRETRFQPHHPDIAISLNNLALIYSATGQYKKAESLYLKALNIREDVKTLNNLGSLYVETQQYEQAESLYSKVLKLKEEQLGANHPSTATSLNSLGVMYRETKRYQDAEHVLTRALDILEEKLGSKHPSTAISLNNLALLYRSMRRYPEAENLYKRAIAIHDNSITINNAQSLFNLAFLYKVQGDYYQALDYEEQSLQILDEYLRYNLASQPEETQQAYLQSMAGTDDSIISLNLQHLPQDERARRTALNTVLQRKGFILDMLSGNQQRLLNNLNPEAQALLAQLNQIRRQLSALMFNPPNHFSSNQYRTQLHQLTAEATQVESALARHNAIFCADTQRVDWDAVVASLPDNSVLLEYVLYTPSYPETEKMGEPRYAAYLLFSDKRIEAVDLGAAADIDTAVWAFTRFLRNTHENLQQANNLPTVGSEIVVKTTQSIHKLVFEPMASYLQGVEHLLISPDGQLNRLPFEALQSEAGGDYLVQKYQISYLNSGRDLLRFNVVESSLNPSVIVANPDYEIAEAREQLVQESMSSQQDQEENRDFGNNHYSIELSKLRVDPLPGTAAEADAIAALLPDAEMFTGTNATENSLKQVKSPRILHIATHSFFLPALNYLAPQVETFELSFNVFTTQFSSSAPVENPLLRSGLALAGFNPRSSGREDGVFTALEASQLNLLGTQLVVLSACETGLGDIANGEGVYGLRRAFALAGAEAQLMSLWPVSDYGTQSLMSRYYEKLTAGQGRSEALRNVQLEMIASEGPYSHPYYWAAFILTGNWQPL